MALLIGLTLGLVVIAWDVELLHICLPYIKTELDLSYTQIGFIPLLQVFFGGLISVPGGIIADLFSLRKSALALMLLWGGVVYFFAGFSTSYLMLLLIIMLRPLTPILWQPASVILIVKHFPDKMGFALGFRGTGSSFGQGLCGLIIGFCLGHISWRTVFQLNFIPGLIMAVIFWFLTPTLSANSVRAEKGKGGFKYSFKKEILTNTKFIIALSINCLRACGQKTSKTFIPIWLALQLNFPPAMIGMFIAIFSFTSIPGKILMGYLSDQLGRKPVIFITFFLGGLSIYLFTVLKTTFGLVIVVTLMGIFVISMRPSFVALAMDTIPAEIAGTASASIGTSERIISPFAPLIFGYLSDVFGLTFAFSILSIMFSLSAFSVYFLSETKSK